MRPNKTKAAIQDGQTVLGCFLRYPSASLVEVLTYQAWDFIVFDAEHGTIQPEDCENMVRAAELQGVTPIVRVTTNQAPVILRYMDSGAQGLHVPWVNSASEAEAVVQSVKYHPRGVRGLAGVRAADYALRGSFSDYVRFANQESLVVIHIETAEAVEQLPEIVKVDGLDVIFIGPTDLSHSYGVPGEPQHPTVQAAIDRIVEVVGKSGLALGIMVSNAQAAQQWRERGARYITIGFESVLMPAVKAYLEKARA
ncbi:MAG: 2,4-dihydroxyhept-2-ene-1,7-dioic acid aldolase [Chloroflexota bacterium]|nr:MAG: 2,4-dihydroxyhept-2-ene-1,7-dioic acid aldolase [Chloroflexota bacterium]